MELLDIETFPLIKPISENVEQATRNQVLSNDFPAPQTELESRVLNIDQNIVNIDNTEDLNDNFEEFERPSSTPSDLCTESSGLGINPHVNATLLESNNIQEMPPEVRNALGSLEIPEGVDPSFLAALPEEMREEVIQEHLRMQRVRQRAQQSSSQTTHDSVLEVNPEFLAALPPNIQSEVLMQQRIEQQRQVAQSTNPEDPVDAGLFFQNLPDSLRQAILTDMDESQIASLPPDLAAEAQYLRSDWESRNSARLNAHQANTLSSTARARFPSSSNSSQDPRWQNSIWYDANGTPQIQHHHHTTIIHHHTQQHGKPIALLLMEDENNLLDPDSLSTLLLFLFIEDTKINFSRLHRIVRNLCFHVPTREWIIHALISIIQKVNLEKTTHDFKKAMKPQWLKFRAYTFGYKSDVFIINKFRQCCKNTNYYTILDIFLKNYTLDINPQATQMIIRNCLDILFVLAKHFPRSFIPFNIDNKITTDNADTVPSHSISKNDSFLPSTHADSPLMENKQNFAQSNIDFDDLPTTSKDAFVNRSSQKSTCLKNKNASEELIYNTNAKSFWDVILSLDMGTSCRSLNLHAFPLKANPRWEWKKKKKVFLSFSDSPFSKLLEMLPYKDICRSPQLTDMLVKLLGSLSISLSKESNQLDAESNAECFQQCNKPEDLKSKKETDDLVSCKEDYKKDIHSKLSKPKKTNRTIYSKNFSQLKLIVEVLTHQSGTSEGLDDIAKLISNLSLCSEVYNAIFLHYLQKAILGLSDQVQKSIQNLWDELRQANVLSNETASTSQNAQNLKDNFNAENVNMSERTKIKSLSQLQIPAMKKLLSTSSSQIFFLKTLKMFTQVREFYDNRNINKTLESSLLCKQSLSQIFVLDSLWNSLSACLFELEKSKDEYAVLVLQPVVEVFFLIYGSQKTESKGNSRRKPSAQENYSEIQNAESQKLMDLEATNTSYLSSEEDQFSTDNAKNTKSDQLCVKETQIKNDRLKLISFAEKHRSIINQILRQSHVHLSDGPFAVLVDYTRILDFDVKRKYFQTELERIDEGVRREENTVSVRRVTVFEDSFRVLYRLGSEEWKNRFYIVFEDEEGQDAGGLLREWYVIISREIFNPMYALFCVSPGDRVTYMINPSSYANPNHLSYFKFVGRVIAKAIHDNKLLECYFTRSFYKHILGKQVKYTDMESQDYEFYKGLDYLMKNNVSTLGYELTFSTEVQEFGMTQVRDLIPNGRDIVVTEENKFEYVQLVCQLKMSGSIRQQLDAFLEGFYDIIPKHLISIFNEQELELLISGLPDIDIEDLKLNTEYHKYTAKSNQIQWFWRALRSFDQADRAKFLQFVTGTSKVPLQGFKSLEGMNGIQKLQIHRDDRSTDRLPCAHTCFNQLDLPMYKSYEKLRSCLLKAIHECSEGFGFA